jgi:hypothetical protein
MVYTVAMATQYPVYALFVKLSQGHITWKELQEVIEQWLSSTPMRGYQRDEWQDVIMAGQDQHSTWSLNVPRDMGQSSALALAESIQNRFPFATVTIQETVHNVMESGDAEELLAGRKLPIRKRGSIN